MSLLHRTAALFVALIWGINFVVIEVALQDFPPLLFAAMRFALVAVFALTCLPLPKRHFLPVAAFGILMGFLQFGFMFVAMDGHADAGSSALLIQAQVPMTLLLAAVLFRDALSVRQWLGVTVSALGLALLFVQQDSRVDGLGLVLLMLAAASFAGGNIVMRMTADLSAFHLVAWSCVVPPLPLLALSLAVESRAPFALLAEASAPAWFALVYIALLATLVGFGIWGRLLSRYSTADVLPFAMCVPVFAQLGGRIWLAEPFGVVELLITSVVIAGVLLSQVASRPRNPIEYGSLEKDLSADGAPNATQVAATQCCPRI